MAMQLEKSGGLMLDRGGMEGRATEKPKNHQELGLFLALIALVVLALYVSLHTLDWPVVTHAFKAILAIIR